VNNPAEGESIAIRIYHGNIGTIGRISGNKITANTHAIFISNNSTLECLAENGIYWVPSLSKMMLRSVTCMCGGIG
jgi:hypothetical protein